jgi:hypothetical protein
MYRDDQLRPPGNAAGSTSSNKRLPALFGLTAMLLTDPDLSTAQPPTTPTEQVPLHAPTDTVAVPGTAISALDSVKSLLVHGLVRDKEGPLPYAVVMVKDGTLFASTDRDGRFTLDLSEWAGDSSKVVLVTSSIGLAKQEWTIDLLKPSFVIFELTEELDTYPLIFAVRPPLHKRIWWKITAPFRP